MEGSWPYSFEIGLDTLALTHDRIPVGRSAGWLARKLWEVSIVTHKAYAVIKGRDADVSAACRAEDWLDRYPDSLFASSFIDASDGERVTVTVEAIVDKVLVRGIPRANPKVLADGSLEREFIRLPDYVGKEPIADYRDDLIQASCVAILEAKPLEAATLRDVCRGVFQACYDLTHTIADASALASLMDSDSEPEVDGYLDADVEAEADWCEAQFVARYMDTSALTAAESEVTHLALAQMPLNASQRTLLTRARRKLASRIEATDALISTNGVIRRRHKLSTGRKWRETEGTTLAESMRRIDLVAERSHAMPQSPSTAHVAVYGLARPIVSLYGLAHRGHAGATHPRRRVIDADGLAWQSVEGYAMA